MDTIFCNGKILTMRFRSAEEEKAQPTEAILVRDGRIVAVGVKEKIDALSGTETETVDLGGRCLMPGFIDPHSHFIMNGSTAMWADLSDCESHDDIVETLRRYREASGNPARIIGFGYDHNFLREGTHPDKRTLDSVSTEIPIFVMHVSFHMGCANSKVLKLAGIDASTPDPEGGRIGRIEGTQEPSGYFEETALHQLIGGFSVRGSGGDARMAAKMQETYLRCGITTAQDGATTAAEMQALDKLAESGLLRMDVVAYPLMSDHGEEVMRRYEKYVGGYHGHVKIGGYKILLDGSPQGRSAWMSRPYLGGEENYCAYPWMSDEQAEAYIASAIAEGKQLLAHCNGDAAAEQFICAYEKVREKLNGPRDLRPVMIHCQTVRNDQLDRMKALDMIASVFVGHVWYWGDIHMRNFGPERGNRISPVRDALDRGLHVNFHQDTPVTRPDMLHSVWCAVNRISRRGTVIGAEEAIPVYAALRAVTIEGAYEYFEEDTKGTIEEGKRADLVILDRSPLEVEPMEIRNIKVCETFKDGQSVYRA